MHSDTQGADACGQWRTQTGSKCVRTMTEGVAPFDRSLSSAQLYRPDALLLRQTPQHLKAVAVVERPLGRYVHVDRAVNLNASLKQGIGRRR